MCDELEWEQTAKGHIHLCTYTPDVLVSDITFVVMHGPSHDVVSSPHTCCISDSHPRTCRLLNYLLLSLSLCYTAPVSQGYDCKLTVLGQICQGFLWLCPAALPLFVYELCSFILHMVSTFY